MIDKETRKKLNEFEELLLIQKQAIKKLIQNLINERQSHLKKHSDN